MTVLLGIPMETAILATEKGFPSMSPIATHRPTNLVSILARLRLRPTRHVEIVAPIGGS